MKKPDTILEEIHAIRNELYEEVKDMSSSERTVFFAERAEAVANEFGFQIATPEQISELCRSTE